MLLLLVALAGADEAGSTGQQLMLEEAAKGVRATRARHA